MQEESSQIVEETIASEQPIEITKNQKDVLLVLYASETGTGESIAEGIQADCCDREIDCEIQAVCDMQDWLEPTKYSYIFFISASTGDGDPPELCNSWWRWYRRGKGVQLLANTKVCFLSLGDSNYASYMGFPRRARNRILKDESIQEFLEHVEADDAQPGGLEEAVDGMLEKLWLVFKREGIGQEFTEGTRQKFIRSKRNQSLKVCGKDEKKWKDEALSSTWGFTTSRFMSSKLVTGKDSLSKILHVEVAWEEAWEAGSAFMVYCPNSPRIVMDLIKRMNLDKYTVYGLIPMAKQMPAHLHFPSTVFDIFSWMADLTFCPSKRVLRHLGDYCSDPKDKEKVRGFVDRTDEAHSMYLKLLASNVTFVQVLEELSSCKIPIEKLLRILPRLRPRPYSAANVFDKKKNVLHLAMTLVEKEDFQGVATGWFSNISKIMGFIEGGRVTHQKLLIEQNRNVVDDQKEDEWRVLVLPKPLRDFRLPNKAIPIIMISTGSGIAPFRSFCMKINKHKRKYKGSVVFFGCRYRDIDFPYKEEFERFHKEGAIAGLYVATSREGEKQYVQDLLLREQEMIWNLIEKKKANIYVCGDPKKMGKSVWETFVKIAANQGGHFKAEKYMINMIDEKRYNTEIW